MLLAAAPLEQEKIDALYRRGLEGEKQAVLDCIAALESVLAKAPSNQLARVYLGSAYTLKSRDLGFGPKKLATLKQGLALMDAAVAAAPEDPKVRLPRALTTSALPAILGHGATSRKDFLQLAQMADTHPEKFAAGELQLVYHHAARATGERERAAALYRKSLAHPVDTALAATTRAELGVP